MPRLKTLGARLLNGVKLWTDRTFQWMTCWKFRDLTNSWSAFPYGIPTPRYQGTEHLVLHFIMILEKLVLTFRSQKVSLKKPLYNHEERRPSVQGDRPSISSCFGPKGDSSSDGSRLEIWPWNWSCSTSEKEGRCSFLEHRWDQEAQNSQQSDRGEEGAVCLAVHGTPLSKAPLLTT